MTLEGDRVLVVTADDYGLTRGVSEAILDAHERGVLTSTSVLVLGSGFEDTVGLLPASGIGAGVHLAAVGEDPPLLPAREIPTLVDKRGRLARSWRSLLPRVMAGRVDPGDLEREFGAQIDAVRDAGVTVTHLDTHQHVHLWPAIGNVVLRLASARGISAVRITRARGHGPKARGVNRLAHGLERRADDARIRYPEASAGLDEAGRFDLARARRAVERLAATPARTLEISMHPGPAEDPDRARYRWGYWWERELDALTSDDLRSAVEHAGLRLGSYRDI